MKPFESFLATQIQEFIAYRQNLGYQISHSRSHLKTFDRYLKNQKIEKSLLPPSFFLQLRSNLKIEPRSINRILSSLRVFFKFLIRKGIYAQNPLQDIPELPENDSIPFIFSPQQIDQLLSAVCKRLRQTKRYYLKDLSQYMAILLMARCGLRISEPLRLSRHHYQPKEKTIYIEKTKFKKDRLIPLPLTVATDMENYLAVRDALLIEQPNPFLLAGFKQKGLNDSTLRAHFHRAVEDIGLKQPRQIIGKMTFSSPTPHSLRHSFAVNTLNVVKHRGNCPQNALPVLATYMGHSEYRYTTQYLKVLDAKQRQQLFCFARSQKEHR
jgi:site-specific recombinase XerD